MTVDQERRIREIEAAARHLAPRMTEEMVVGTLVGDPLLGTNDDPFRDLTTVVAAQMAIRLLGLDEGEIEARVARITCAAAWSFHHP